MVSVVIKNNGEPNVIQMTFEILYKELKDIKGSELLIKDTWDVNDVKNRFACFVEADCMVQEGYFQKQLEVFKTLSPRVIALGATTSIKYWDNKIYGYYLSDKFDSTVIPVRKAKTSRPHPVQIAYVPGALIRTKSLKRILKKILVSNPEEDLVYYSSLISLGVWHTGITQDNKHPQGQLGTQIYLNPDANYYTTEDYVNDIGKYNQPIRDDLLSLFARESI